MRIKLSDGAPRSKAEVAINVSKNGNTLEIGIDGTVAPVVLEYYEGKVRLRVYGSDQTKPIFTSDLDATPAPVVETAPVVAATAPVAVVAPVVAPAAEKAVVAVLPVAAATVAAPTDDELAAFDAA